MFIFCYKSYKSGCEYDRVLIVCMEEDKGEEEPTQTILRECRKYKEDRGCESQFSEDLQT